MSTYADGVVKRHALTRIEKTVDKIVQAEQARDEAVAAAVAHGCTWAEIGRALGVSAQAAHRRFRWLRLDPETGELWREPPLPL